MRSRYPNQQTQLPVSLDVYQQLQWASCNTGYQKEDWEIAAEAVDEWVRRHDPDSLPGPAHAGYQWKRLFLPNGTVLRTVFAGKNCHCVVEGDRIVYDKRAVSPSGFVNAVGGIRRNAWKCTWILFPDSKDWKLADSLRTRAQARHVRKRAGAVQQERWPSGPRAPVDVPPVPVDAVTDRPVNVGPARVAQPARRGRFALAAFKARHARHTIDVACQPQPNPEEAPSPQRFTWGHDRRHNFPPQGTGRRREASG